MSDKFEFIRPPEAPVFRPSAEEFGSDPLEFVAKIRDQVEPYGICKIIPPKTWKPPFCVDANTFKFTPRIQRINELEAGTRIRIEFIEELAKFWELQGKKFKIPTVEKKPLDLYKLQKLVSQLGGSHHLTETKKWSQVAKELHLRDYQSTQIIKRYYEKLLFAYDMFKMGATIPSSTEIASKNDHNNDDEKKGNCVKKVESINCMVCERGDDEPYILLCDGCDMGYHTYCLFPPVEEIPKGDWRCAKCIGEICNSKPTDGYGFEQSPKEYSLAEFGVMADEFKVDYFKRGDVASDEVEKEYWRILAQPDSGISVKYGADLHTIDVGSGFPMLKRDGEKKAPVGEYIASQWNLNNLPMHRSSVLSHLNVEISGMKIPWVYVGMVFSTFAWHVEDHWSYSVNYLHWGEPKTWYGIGRPYAEHFENAMRQNAPELFNKAPDLLHHLVTIMNPNILMKQGVPVSRIDQHAGEFIITFPRAYHAGFNQGYNFAEAVNFCPADWVSVGREAVESYKEFKRYSVFSHEELVCNLASKEDLNADIVRVIADELEYLIECEKKHRQIASDKGVTKSVRENFELMPDDDRICEFCKATCFVSAITCPCSNKLVCVNHMDHLCECDVKQYCLKYRYTLDELMNLILKAKKQSSELAEWENSVTKLLRKTEPKCSLADLKSLLIVAKNRNYSEENLTVKTLKQHIENAEKCAAATKKFILAYENKIKTEDSKCKRVDYDEFKELKRDIEALPCELSELPMVSDVFNTLEILENRVRDAIDNVLLDINELKKLLELICKVNISIPGAEILSAQYEQALWIEKLNYSLENPSTLTIEIINGLIDSALKIPYQTHIKKQLMDLQELASIALNFDQKVKSHLEFKLPLELAELEKLIQQAQYIPVVMDSLKKLCDLVENAKKWTTQANLLIMNNKQNNLRDLEDAIQSGKKIRVKLEQLKLLEEKVSQMNEWKSKLDKEFLKDFKPKSLLEILFPRRDFEPMLNKSNVSSVNKKLNKKGTKMECYSYEDYENMLVDGTVDLNEILKDMEQREFDALTQLRKANSTRTEEVYKRAKLANEKKKDLQQLSSDAANDCSKNGFKCCVCVKVISNLLAIKRCDLCLDIMHDTCYNQNTIAKVENVAKSSLCENCTRSKRPSIDTINQITSSLYKIGIKSVESFAYKYFLERISGWQQRIVELLTNNAQFSTHLHYISEFVSDFQRIQNSVTMKISDEVKYSSMIDKYYNLYSLLNDTIKSELNELWIKGLLLEFNSKETRLLALIHNLNQYTNGASVVYEYFSNAPKSSKESNYKKSLYKPTVNMKATDDTKVTKVKAIKKEDDSKKARKKRDSSLEPDRNQRKMAKMEKITSEDESVEFIDEKKATEQNEDVCASKNCLIPTGDNIEWVQCDGSCNRWFHLSCVGLEKIEKNEEYVCIACKSSTS